MAKLREINSVMCTMYMFLATGTILTESKSVPKIIGGTEAAPGEFPWHVSLQSPSGGSNFNSACGATIISTREVLTAAHCVRYISSYPDNSWRIVAGAHKLSQSEETQQIAYILTDKVVIHPSYTGRDNDTHDIALLATDRDLNINSAVMPLRLPSLDDHLPEECTIAGWGQTETSTESEVLLKAEVPIVPKWMCDQIYGDVFDSDRQLCAGKLEGGVDFCSGDTGGGLFCYANDNHQDPYLAGVSIGGYLCAKPGFPGIYMDLAGLLQWVQENRYEEISQSHTNSC